MFHCFVRIQRINISFWYKYKLYKSISPLASFNLEMSLTRLLTVKTAVFIIKMGKSPGKINITLLTGYLSKVDTKDFL